MKCIEKIIKAFSARRLFILFVILLCVFFLFTLIAYYYLSYKIIKLEIRKPIKSTISEENLLIDVYCNSPSNINLYDEGLSNLKLSNQKLSDLNSEFDLVKVIVLIRHGDRGPLRPVRNFNLISCDPARSNKIEKSSLKLLNQFIIDAKLKLSQSPAFSPLYLLLPTDSKCNLGQLTPYGVLQHLTLGSFIGQLYKNKLQLDQNNIQIFTTQYSRTYQSAIAFLYGFLRPKNDTDFKNFPKIEMTRGIFFCTTDEYCLDKCKKIDQLQQQMDYAKYNYLETHPEMKDLIYQLKHIISPNENYTELFQTPVALFDGFMAYYCHNNEFPCDKQRNCVNLDHINKISSYIISHGKQMSMLNTFKHLSWLKTIGFLNQLASVFNHIKSNNARFVLFSAHDLTIVAVSSALGFFDGILPQYASRVVFELYKNNYDHFYYFRIIYNGKDVTHLTEVCKLDQNNCLTISNQNSKLINVNAFEKYIKENFQLITGAKTYKMACNN